jgi:hypothetical protein
MRRIQGHEERGKEQQITITKRYLKQRNKQNSMKMKKETDDATKFSETWTIEWR